MEQSPKQKEPLKRRALKKLGAWAGAAALGLTVGTAASYLPARGPDPEEDCRSKLDQISETTHHGNYHEYELTRMTRDADCTNAYMRLNRRDGHDGSFDKQLKVGDERVLCWDPDYPDQLQIKLRKFERDYVHISRRLQHQIENDEIHIPRC